MTSMPSALRPATTASVAVADGSYSLTIWDRVRKCRKRELVGSLTALASAGNSASWGPLTSTEKSIGVAVVTDATTFPRRAKPGMTEGRAGRATFGRGRGASPGDAPAGPATTAASTTAGKNRTAILRRCATGKG